jgi:hypothetical protein
MLGLIQGRPHGTEERIALEGLSEEGNRASLHGALTRLFVAMKPSG